MINLISESKEYNLLFDASMFKITKEVTFGFKNNTSLYIHIHVEMYCLCLDFFVLKLLILRTPSYFHYFCF